MLSVNKSQRLGIYGLAIRLGCAPVSRGQSDDWLKFGHTLNDIHI